VLEDCDEENSSDNFSLDGTRLAVPWPVDVNDGIKKED
jgi:hypothetical protein